MDRLSLTLPAPAKLNLFLNIVGRRADGYHELQTVFQLINRCDTLRFELAPRGTEVSSNGLDLPMAQNLVFKAAERLRAVSGCDKGVAITLDKQIPSGAGLGGGSSDAATTLAGLNRLWHLGLDSAQLQAIGITLGADVPVFLFGDTAWAEGIGEKLQAIDLPEKWYLVIDPGCEVSTAGVFADADLTRSNTPITIARFLRHGAENVCEPVVRRAYPQVDAALHWLRRWGRAMMTGTGSCVFLAFDTETAANELLAKVPAEWTGFVASGTKQSPLHHAIERAEQFIS